ncbi:MAG TPA: hypothetical protein VNL15_02600, partial [Dehalococcoidia bacterium]|nr:hypothetical protein [Dehalococcoidia bacterium]
ESAASLEAVAGELPAGYGRPDDPAFLLWFERQATNPYWLIALAVMDDPEGRAQLRRYRELTGYDPLLPALDALPKPEDAAKVLAMAMGMTLEQAERAIAMRRQERLRREAQERRRMQEEAERVAAERKREAELDRVRELVNQALSAMTPADIQVMRQRIGVNGA